MITCNAQLSKGVQEASLIVVLLDLSDQLSHVSRSFLLLFHGTSTAKIQICSTFTALRGVHALMISRTSFIQRSHRALLSALTLQTELVLTATTLRYTIRFTDCALYR